MKVGTRSVLFGVHCFLIHPWFVAMAWWRLYGFPADPRLWVAFFCHDLGYIGKPNMDGVEGEEHPAMGALIVSWICDGRWPHILADLRTERAWSTLDGGTRRYWYPRTVLPVRAGLWHDFTLLHSRYYAKSLGAPFSRLCVADKYSICVTPWWVYKILGNLSGEIHEYLDNAVRRSRDNEAVRPEERAQLTSKRQREWFIGLQAYMRRWCEEHRDGRPDTWTKRQAA